MELQFTLKTERLAEICLRISLFCSKRCLAPSKAEFKNEINISNVGIVYGNVSLNPANNMCQVIET